MWSSSHSSYKTRNANDFCLALLVQRLCDAQKHEQFTLMWVTCCHAVRGNAAVRAAINQSDQQKPAGWFSACCLTWLSGSLSVHRITQPNSAAMIYGWAAHEIRCSTDSTVGVFQEEIWANLLTVLKRFWSFWHIFPHFKSRFNPNVWRMLASFGEASKKMNKTSPVVSLVIISSDKNVWHDRKSAEFSWTIKKRFEILNDVFQFCLKSNKLRKLLL